MLNLFKDCGGKMLVVIVTLGLRFWVFKEVVYRFTRFRL